MQLMVLNVNNSLFNLLLEISSVLPHILILCYLLVVIKFYFDLLFWILTSKMSVIYHTFIKVVLHFIHHDVY